LAAVAITVASFRPATDALSTLILTPAVIGVALFSSSTDKTGEPSKVVGIFEANARVVK